jgi:hypothetical protein
VRNKRYKEQRDAALSDPPHQKILLQESRGRLHNDEKHGEISRATSKPRAAWTRIIDLELISMEHDAFQTSAERRPHRAHSLSLRNSTISDLSDLEVRSTKSRNARLRVSPIDDANDHF